MVCILYCVRYEPVLQLRLRSSLGESRLCAPGRQVVLVVAHASRKLTSSTQIYPDLLPLLLALVLATREDEDAAVDQEKPYEVKSVPSKGLGAFADTSIPRGAIIISERALLIWPSKLSLEEAQRLISALTPSARKAFYSLANIADPSLNLDPIFGIRATNGFNVELPGMPAKLTSATLTSNPTPKTASFIFPRIARINHSCAPNADHAMDWSGLKMTVYATTEIEQSQEICIEYQSGLVQKTRDERRQSLKRDFGFDCHCPVCAQDGEALSRSDGRRREINAIVTALGDGKMPNKDAMWKTLERLENLLDQEGYKAMPEFTHQRVSDAYVGFKTLKQQRQS